MKRIYAGAATLLIVATAFAFDFDSYSAISYDMLAPALRENLEPTSTDIRKSLGWKIAFPARLSSYPTNERDPEFEEEIAYFHEYFGVEGGLFSHVQPLPLEEYVLVVLWQSSLLEWLEKDVELEEVIDLYCVIGYHDPRSSRVVLEVGAFQTLIDYGRRSAIPIWLRADGIPVLGFP